MKEIHLNDPVLQHVFGGKGGQDKKSSKPKKSKATPPSCDLPVTTLAVGEESPSGPITGNPGGPDTVTTMAIGEESGSYNNLSNSGALGSF
jgi:hypothetical protein